MSALTWVGVALCGGLGALARALLEGMVASGRAASGRAGALPLATFAVNVSGAFALGLCAGLALRGAAADLVSSALIGSYTTFSTWMLDSARLRDRGRPGVAAANVAGSLAVGLGAVALGRAIGARF